MLYWHLYSQQSTQKGILVRKELRVPEETFDSERTALEFFKIALHPNLIRLLFWYRHKDASNLVFPCYPGNLQAVLRTGWLPNPIAMSGTFEGSRLNNWLWENLMGVVDGLESVHNPKDASLAELAGGTIGAHFDLKPANILVDVDGRLVISDFGLARIKGADRMVRSSLTSPGGTLPYQPPPQESENIRMERDAAIQRHWSRAYDVWSMACIMVEVILYICHGTEGVNSFTERLKGEDDPQSRSGTFWKMDRNGYSLKKAVLDFLDEIDHTGDRYLVKVATWLQKMFEVDYKRRPTAKEVQNALFGGKVIDSLKLGAFVSICGAETQHPLRDM